MGILDIVFENFKKIEKAYVEHGGSNSIEEYLALVISEIIKKDNYDLILDEESKDIFKNKIGRDAIVIDTIKATIDYFCSMLNLEIADKEFEDFGIANKVVTEAIKTGGKLPVSSFIEKHFDEIDTICRIYVSTIGALDKSIRQSSVQDTSPILNQIVEKLNERQRNAVLDSSILSVRKSSYHF